MSSTSSSPSSKLYFEEVLSGEIVACKKLRKLAERMLHDFEHQGKWHFDQSKADRAVDFIERFCYIPSGRLGQPFKLELYEKAIIETIFGWVDDDGLRRFQEALVVVGRKNGKTSLAAAIEMYMLVADGEGSPQIYNLATNSEQADLCYKACQKMRKQSPLISKKVRKRQDDLWCDRNLGYIKPLSSKSDTKDGLDVHMATLDEIHAMKSRELYDVVKQGMSARDQPLLFQITTAGFVRNSIYDAQYEYASKWLDGELEDERFVAFIYELDEREEWEHESAWMKANPGLGTVKKLDTLRGFVQKAKSDPSFLPTVLTKDFNIPQNAASAWLTFDEAINIATYDFEEMNFRYGICGFDAADTIDLTCAQMLMMRPDDDHIYERSMYWIPEDAIEEYDAMNKDRDGVPYRLWISRGLMRTVPGNKVDKRVLLDWLTELRDEEDLYTYAIGIDPWHIDDSTRRDLEAFVGKQRLFNVRQGAITLSQPMKQIRADYQANRIVDNNHPINSWCRMNVSIKADVNGNIQPYKKNADQRNRIDGFAAELDAYVVLCNLYDDYSQVC